MFRQGMGGVQSCFGGGGGFGPPIFMPNLKAGGSLKDMATGVPALCSISGTRYGIGDNNEIIQFGANKAPIEKKGLRGCPSYTQYFLNNESPVTQSITLAAGSYCLWIEGSGSATFNGLTATEAAPKVFTLASGFTGDCVISGTVTKIMLNSGLFPAPFSPTQGVVTSFVSEAATATTGTSFDLDDAKLARLKTALRGPNAQGRLDLEFVSNVDSGWLANNTNVSMWSIGNSNANGLFIRKDSAGQVSIRFVDTAINLSPSVRDLTAGQAFKISLDWGAHSTGWKMRLTVNGVKSSLADFSGSFGIQDLRFFFGNTVHAGWIVKDSLKVMDRPQW